MSGATLNRVLSDPNWAADRIEALEADLDEADRTINAFGKVTPEQYQKELAAKSARIEALEAALRTDDANLRLLVDIVWQHATESTAVPFYKTSDMLIAKYRAAFAGAKPWPQDAIDQEMIERTDDGWSRRAALDSEDGSEGGHAPAD